MNDPDASIGHTLWGWARELFPICRSITGPGTRQTLRWIQQQVPGMTVHAVPSGTPAFDWTTPPEWTIRDAWIADGTGTRIIDFRRSNLHVVGYSEPVDRWMELEELDCHLHSRPDLPEAIPYVTSYYERRWGFCLSHRQRASLRPGRYRVVIDSDLAPGELNYGELKLPGRSTEEIFLSTYVCHPSMANNELSGPVVATALAQWLQAQPDRRYSYRFVFIPETIVSIVYLSRNLDEMKARVVAGFNLSCVGDERCYSYLPSRNGGTLADRVALHVLQHTDPDFRRYSFLDRGSDERQYCAPGVDLPVAGILRSKFGTYPEYHTSLDNLDLVTPKGLAGGYLALRRAIETLECNGRLAATVLCEPQLGRRGLYPSLSRGGSRQAIRALSNLLAWADGRTLLEIAETIGEPCWTLRPVAETLVGHGLLRDIDGVLPATVPPAG